jgi:hypothetical protein
LPFVLRIESILLAAGIVVRSGDGEVRGGRQTEQQIAEGAASEGVLIEGD